MNKEKSKPQEINYLAKALRQYIAEEIHCKGIKSENVVLKIDLKLIKFLVHKAPTMISVYERDKDFRYTNLKKGSVIYFGGVALKAV